MFDKYLIFTLKNVFSMELPFTHHLLHKGEFMLHFCPVIALMETIREKNLKNAIFEPFVMFHFLHNTFKLPHWLSLDRIFSFFTYIYHIARIAQKISCTLYASVVINENEMQWSRIILSVALFLIFLI